MWLRVQELRRLTAEPHRRRPRPQPVLLLRLLGVELETQRVGLPNYHRMVRALHFLKVAPPKAR